MNVSQVTVSQLRVTKPFENERIEVTVSLDKGESAGEAVQRARKFLAAHFGDDTDDVCGEELRNAIRTVRRAGCSVNAGKTMPEEF